LIFFSFAGYSETTISLKLLKFNLVSLLLPGKRGRHRKIKLNKKKDQKQRKKTSSFFNFKSI